MKIALLQPDDVNYASRNLAYASPRRPPETGLAVLAAWLYNFSRQKNSLGVTILDPYQSGEKIIKTSHQADLLGLSSLYSNYNECLNIAAEVKRIKPDIKIVMGGPNAAMLGGLILKKRSCVDFVIGSQKCFDGENGLLGLIDAWPKGKIPNLWHRNYRGVVQFTFSEATDLKKMPLWDYENHQAAGQRLKEYLSKKQDPWLVSPLSVFCFRGCSKASRQGRCVFCTSAEESVCRTLSPDNFWRQINHLLKKYGADIFYVGDDIFTVSPDWIKKIRLAKPRGLNVKLRAYSYLPDLCRMDEEKLRSMAADLAAMGIFNLFFGIESFSPKILKKANKEFISAESAIKIMGLLGGFGVKSTVAILIGLPGESADTLRATVEAVNYLLENSAGAFERLYLSRAVPFRGTPLFDRLLKIGRLAGEYHKAAGHSLADEDSPDYNLLMRLLLKYETSISEEEADTALFVLSSLAEKFMPKHRIGGFELKTTSSK